MKSLSKADLRPAAYQLIPLAKLLANNLSGLLIADGVGVGKTISAGYIITYARPKLRKPAFVVCSPTLISKWIFELKSKFHITALPVRSVEDLETAKNESAFRSTASKQPVYVMSNTLLTSVSREDYPPTSAAIFDEVHTYRNPTTKWHKGCLELAQTAAIRIGLSATPINNRLEDLVSEINILIPNYDLSVINGVVTDLWHSNRELLTGGLVTRFLKDRLGIHFAKRIVQDIQVSYPISYVREATRAINERTAGTTLLEQITYYRLAASSPWAFWSSLGMKKLRERWEDPKLAALAKIIAETDGEVSHWLIFCEFKETVEFLSQKPVHPYIYTMTGDTPMFDRESIVDSFRRAPKALLIVTSVGSEGLDFQFCGGLVNYDLHWNPMKLEQRAGRIDRVGQERKTIYLVNIHVTHSIDERVLSVLRRKLELISNSVFAPSPLLSDSETHRGGPDQEVVLYSDESVTSEVEVGSDLVETFKFNGQMETQDYSALLLVETSLCDPSILENTAERITASSIVSSEEWLKYVSDGSSSILNLLKDYS
jgi:superfamily II DNA or RNA helicase